MDEELPRRRLREHLDRHRPPRPLPLVHVRPEPEADLLLPLHLILRNRATRQPHRVREAAQAAQRADARLHELPVESVARLGQTPRAVVPKLKRALEGLDCLGHLVPADLQDPDELGIVVRLERCAQELAQVCGVPGTVVCVLSRGERQEVR